MSKLEEAAIAYVNGKASHYGPWDIKAFDGYPCPHCGHEADKDFSNGALWLLAEADKLGICCDLPGCTIRAPIEIFQLKKLTED